MHRGDKWRKDRKKKDMRKSGRPTCTHTSAIITDTWHNTSQSINITTQICIGTDSHSLKKIHLPLYFCLCISVYFPTHISLNLIPEARASFPGERVNVTELPLHCHSAAALLSAHYSTKIFRKIDPSRLFSALRLPPKPSMDHPVVC